MEIKVVDELTGEDIKPKEINDGDKTAPLVDNSFLFQGVAQLFDLKPSEISQYHGKLDTLIRYAKTQTKETTPEAIKWAIRSLQNKVGTPPLGEKWINYLSKYAYLKLENLKLTDEIAKYDYR